MSDPTDASWWFGGPQYTPDPNAAVLQDGSQQRNTIGGALAQSNPGQQATFDQSGSNYWNGQQQALNQQLGAVASGQQQGAGELAVNRQIGQAQAAQQSIAASARGANAMLGGREAARQSAGLNIAGAGQAQQAALQDQANARAQQANVQDQARGQSLTAAASALQAQGMNQQQTLSYLSMLTGIDQAELQARMQQEGIAAGSYQPGMIGQAFNAAAGVLGASVGKGGALAGGGK